MPTPDLHWKGMTLRDQLLEWRERALEAEAARSELDYKMRHLLTRIALAATDLDRDHVDRCVEIQRLVGTAEDWSPSGTPAVPDQSDGPGSADG